MFCQNKGSKNTKHCENSVLHGHHVDLVFSTFYDVQKNYECKNMNTNS